jgi:hypothetical protein
MANTVDHIDMKWVELLWDEFKYRHELYWKSLYLWGGAATAVFIAPFLKPELKVLGPAVFIFPVIGLVLALVGAWHLASEGERLMEVGRKFNQFRSASNTSPDGIFTGIRRTWWQQAVSERIVKSVTLLFTAGFGVFTLIDVLFLIILLYPDQWVVPLVVAFITIITAGIGIYVEINQKKDEFNKSIPPPNHLDLE